MPDAFIKSSITPILLNKNGDTRANTTTEPIANVTAMSRYLTMKMTMTMKIFYLT